MSFTQTITVRADDPNALTSLLDGWHRDQAGTAPGYQGVRMLADTAQPGRYVLEVDFSSEQEAEQNNARPETRRWAEKLQKVTAGAPEYHDFRVEYATTGS